MVVRLAGRWCIWRLPLCTSMRKIWCIICQRVPTLATAVAAAASAWWLAPAFLVLVFYLRNRQFPAPRRPASSGTASAPAFCMDLLMWSISRRQIRSLRKAISEFSQPSIGSFVKVSATVAAACLLLRPAAALSATTGGPRSATGIMRQQNQARQQNLHGCDTRIM